MFWKRRGRKRGGAGGLGAEDGYVQERSERCESGEVAIANRSGPFLLFFVDAGTNENRPIVQAAPRHDSHLFGDVTKIEKVGERGGG